MAHWNHSGSGSGAPGSGGGANLETRQEDLSLGQLSIDDSSDSIYRQLELSCHWNSPVLLAIKGNRREEKEAPRKRQRYIDVRMMNQP
ncbi:unnamed protein product [Microthlaspi erraticum]|uniref:Uncharacterized protein n=1 Tax=Microthlaspi erraticum TaxID=1685480 RepID=A0A6D2JL95_9BRAS|nr:unnamed protein product [Microthlaspi erraticum]